MSGPCVHGDRPHTVMYWVEDGGPPIPMTATFDTQPEAVAFAMTGVNQQENLFLRWIKIFRSDNETYTCWRWTNPVEMPALDPVEYEAKDSIKVKPRRRWRPLR